MGQIKNKIQFELLPCGRKVKLIKNYIVKISKDNIIIVPKGSVTDFASVPRFFWRIIPPWGEYSPAAVVHDHLYTKKTFSRAKSDKIFLQLMKRLNVSFLKRIVMYIAVRLFGWLAWRKK